MATADYNIQDELRKLAAVRGSEPFDQVLAAVLECVEADRKSQIPKMLKSWSEAVAKPQSQYFQRVVARSDGKVLRDWSPAVQETSVKNNIKKWHPDYYERRDFIIEQKWDVYTEDGNRWWRGKSSGDEPEPEYR